MTRKKRRLYALSAALAGLGIATALILNAFEDNLVFFYAPSDIAAKNVPDARRFRLGGLVEPNSVERQPDGVTVRFRITDTRMALPVTYTGVLPDLFREGQGVIAEGMLKSGLFIASEVLAKHDENYMPPEVAKALKEAGRWNEGDGKGHTDGNKVGGGTATR